MTAIPDRDRDRDRHQQDDRAERHVRERDPTPHRRSTSRGRAGSARPPTRARASAAARRPSGGAAASGSRSRPRRDSRGCRSRAESRSTRASPDDHARHRVLDGRVRLVEGVVVEHGHEQEPDEAESPCVRDPAPPAREQAAVREHERQSDGPCVEQRPHRPVALQRPALVREVDVEGRAESAPTSMIHAITLRGCRCAISRPTIAGAIETPPIR